MNLEHIVNHKDFFMIKRHGSKQFTSKAIYLFIAKNQDTRIGLIISKKCGKAVNRNRIRRILYNACYKLLNNTKYGDLIIIPHANFLLQYSFDYIVKDINQCINIFINNKK